MLIRPAIGDTDPIRYRRHTPDGQFSGNIIDEAMRPLQVGLLRCLLCNEAGGWGC
jgi:hypothetical protein